MIALEIISDPICPWCYIGKTRLEKALAERPEHPLAPPLWRPFQLNPDMPREGMPRQDYLERKFGGAAGAAQVYGAIEKAAIAEGLALRFDKIARTPNTLDAHRVIRWAAPMPAVQNAAVDTLFRRYFEEGEDISDRDLLLDVAEGAGLERADIAEKLADETDLEEVRAEDEAARRAGVSGVPTFLIHGRFVVPGAQDAEMWVRVIDELTESLSQRSEA